MSNKITIQNFKSTFSSKRKKEKESFKIGLTSTYLIMLSVIAWLLLYYVWILNVNATKGYNIRQLEIEKRELQVEKELLDVKLAELESLSTILKEKDIKSMEKVENPNYLVIKDDVRYVYNN